VYVPNSLDQAVDLTPYCVKRRCDACGRDELFYLTQMKRDRGYYFSFSTGHRLALEDSGVAKTPPAVAQMGMTSMGSRGSAAAYKWRATWSDLAPRHQRLAARAVDAVLAVAAATIGWLVGALIGLAPLWGALLAVLFASAYEPALALLGGTIGKRLLRIEPISTWDCKSLCRSDALRRALVADLQLFPPIAAYNLHPPPATPKRRLGGRGTAERRREGSGYHKGAGRDENDQQSRAARYGVVSSRFLDQVWPVADPISQPLASVFHLG
jgi:hypothetical protein